MSTQFTSRNVLLNRMTKADRDAVAPHLHAVDLPLRKRLAEPNKAIEDVYFLDSGIGSITSNGRWQLPVEIGIIGREGLVNLPIVLGVSQSPSPAFMQVAGAGHSMKASVLSDAMAQSPSLAQLLLQYAYLLMAQVSSTVLANGRGTIDERLARWVLMASDRYDGDALPLTHEFLAIMLGVRRPGVTTALRKLEAAGLIRGERGVIHIVDRAGLEAKAGSFYGVAEAEYARVLGPGRQ